MARHSRKRSRKAHRARSPKAESGGARRTEPTKVESEGVTGTEPPKARTARARRPPATDRPEPLWGPFPLTELVTLAGIVLMTWGFLAGPGASSTSKIVAGFAIASIAGLELAIREHVTGFRSHTTLLSGAVAIATIVALGLGAGLETLGVLLLAGLMAFVGAFVSLRELFKRRSGGFSFR